MKASKPKANTVYYLALLDWGKILTPENMDSFTKDVISSSSPPTDGWATCTLSWSDLKEEVSDIVMGYYHSRFIFRLSLMSVPKDIIEIRKLRTKLEKRVSEFLSDKIFPAMKAYTDKPKIFIYPIFEIQNRETFWNFKKEKPYSLVTTCFYTELDDPKYEGRFSWMSNSLHPRKVRMRVSGAKIITSEMSNWFFWNLINIVFHEGLYRQSREKRKFKSENVHPGLENRLEDFASSLMTTFYELANSRVQDIIAKSVLALTVLGIFIAIVQFVFPILSRVLLPPASPSNSTSLNAVLAAISDLPYSNV